MLEKVYHPDESGLKMMIKMWNTFYFFIEISLGKKKWLIPCSYNRHLQFIDKHLTHTGKIYQENMIAISYLGGFNAELSNSFVDSFCGSYSLKSLIKKPTFFKNQDNPTCIDLVLATR